MSSSKTVNNIWSPVYGNGYYTFTVTELSEINFDLKDFTEPLTLALYDGTGKFIDQETNSLNADFSPGTYYIEIEGKSQSDFTLSIGAQALPHSGGDTMAAAANIGALSTTPKQFSGNLTQPEFTEFGEYYKFTLTTAETVNLGVTDVNSSVTFTLFDGNGLEIESALAGPESDGHNASIVEALAPGTYFVRVEGNGSDNSSGYLLSASIGTPTFGSASSDKAGNTFAAARNIGTLGSAHETFADWVGSTDTQDFYKFAVSGTAMVSLDIAANGFADVALEDADGHALVNPGASPTSDASFLKALGPGTYFIDVGWSFGSGTGYRLSVSAPAIPDGAGNTLTTARNIGALTPTAAVFNDWVGAVDPADYYRFSVKSPSIVTATVSDPTNHGDYLHLSLLTSSGTDIDSAADVFPTFSSDGSIVWALPTGTYYTLVQTGATSVDSGYTLSLSADPTPSDNAGNTTATARNIGPLTSVVKTFTDWVGYSDQDDYYAFTLTDTETVNAKLSGVATNTHFSLLSAGSPPRPIFAGGSATPPDGSDQLASIQLSAGTYYIDVGSKAATGTEYTLSVWTGAPKVGTSAVDSAGNTILAARNIGTLGTAARSFADWVGSTDPADYYQFSIAKASTIDVEAFGASVLPSSLALPPEVSLFDSAGHSIGFNTIGSLLYDLNAGTYYLDVTRGFSSGGYNVSFAATPLPANGAGTSIATAVDLGKLPLPPVPTALALAAGSDSGAKGDGVTNVVKPTITGKGVAGDRVTLFDGAKAIGSAVVAAGGNWAVTPAAALAAGAHSLTATETSATLGTSAASSPFKLTIKTAAPTPSGLAFAVAADKGTAGDTLRVAGHGEAGDTVTLYDGTTAIGSVKVAAGGSWSLTTAKPLGPGAHSLSSREVDVAANVSTVSPAQSLTIDKAAPDNTVVFVGTAHADHFTGGPGRDYFYFSAANLANSDTVAGGGGVNNLVATTAGPLAVQGVRAVQFYWLDKTGADSLALTNANFIGLAGRPPTITIEGGNAGNSVDASKLTGTNRIVAVGGGGNDHFTGGAGNDIFQFSVANLAASDIVTGGGGTDTLVMTTAGTAAVAGVSGVEIYQLGKIGVASLGAIDSLTLTDGNFAGVAGASITVDGGDGGNTVNAAALTGSNRIVAVGSAGTDHFTGGAGNDIFQFSVANLTNTDTVKGGGGTDTLATTSPGAMHVLGVSGVEVFDLSNAAGAADSLALGPKNFAGTAGTIWVYGGNPGSTVNAAAATGTERMIVHAGVTAESAIGGAGNDIFYAGGKTNMTGHGGANFFVFTAPGSNTINDFTAAAAPNNRIEFIAGSGFSLPGATATQKPLGSLFVQDAAGTFSSTTQRFAYGTANGNLYYSASGSTTGEQLVAHLTGDPTLSATQIAHLVFAT